MTEPVRLRVGVYVNDENATTLRLIRCLQSWGMGYASIWRDELARLEPGDCDVLLLHGGWYGIDRAPPMNQADRKQTAEHKRLGRVVSRYVNAGGGVVGVCCGAFNIVWMNLIRAQISRAQGAGPHALEVVDEKHPITRGVIKRTRGRKDRKWKAVPIVRLNGPIFFPKDPATMVFSYDWEQRMGAVLAAGCGRGRAVAISPHPENTFEELSATPDADVKMGPLTDAALILRNALLWAAGRTVVVKSQ